MSAGRGRDAAVQMIDTSVLRVHWHGAASPTTHQDTYTQEGPDEKIHAEVLTVLLAGQGTMFFAGA